MDTPEQYKTLRCERPHPTLLIVAFNRPDHANALNTQMAKDMLALFQTLLLDPGEVRCVILTGVGDKAFCAGGDLKERQGMTDGQWLIQHTLFEQAFYAVMDCPVPVIAAVNGVAYGGGCEFALACDFIYAASTATFAQTEVRLGIIPGGGGTQNLPRAVGTRRAKELILSATPFSAEQAADWGMVNKVCEPEELLEGAIAIAEKIAANGPLAVRQAKRAITVGSEIELKAGLAMEIEAYNRTVGTEDRIEGVRAFNEKRTPDFKGR